MKKLFWIGLLVTLLLASCQPTAETAVSPQPSSPTQAIAEAESVPADTAVPQPTSSPIPTQLPPTAVPSPTAAPTATPIPSPTPAPPPDVPDWVWLPYATGNFGGPVLMLEDGNLASQSMPVTVEIFFDYAAGWLVYGSYFWEATADEQSVTDLHIYNFATDTDQLWAEQVGRAELSPVNATTAGPIVAAAIHTGQDFDLFVLQGPDNAVPLVEGIDPFFSWSPDGGQLAYLRNGDLFITRAAGDSGDPPIATGLYQNSQWIGDAPLWLGDSGYLLIADLPFIIVAADGSGSFAPLAADGAVLEGQRPFAMLYSASTNQLIVENEGMFGTSVAVYQFGERFETAVLSQQVDDAQLVGWHNTDQSVVILSSGTATILPLTPQN